MKLYLSGPITGIAGYRENFKQVEDYLLSQGYDIINPAELDLGEDVNHETYMRRDIKLLATNAVDGLVLMPGWINSKGAAIEVVVARAIGLRLFQLFNSELLEVEQISEAGYMQLAQTLRRAVK